MKKLVSSLLTAGILMTAASGVNAAASGGSSDVNKDLATVRNATTKFHDVETALEAGYINTQTFVKTDEGGMGIHFLNPSLVDGQINLETPEALLYEPTKNGDYKLVGVEYYAPAPLVSEQPSLFGRGFDYMLNHDIEEAFAAGHITQAELDALAKDPNNYHYDLHVWVWEANPNGMFHHWNPHVKDNRTK